MNIVIKADLFDFFGAPARILNVNGSIHAPRYFTVEGYDDNTVKIQDRAMDAVHRVFQDQNLCMYALHPTAELGSLNVRLQGWEVIPEKASPYRFRVALNYSQSADPILNGPWLVTTRGIVRPEPWGVDIAGDPIFVRYRPMNADGSDFYTDAVYNSVPMQKEFKHGAAPPRMMAYGIYQFRTRLDCHMAVQRKLDKWTGFYLGNVNNAVGPYEKNTLLCSDVAINSRDGGGTYDVLVEFLYNPRGHDAFAFYLWQNGQMPGDPSYATGGNSLVPPDHSITEGAKPYGVTRPDQYLPVNFDDPPLSADFSLGINSLRFYPVRGLAAPTTRSPDANDIIVPYINSGLGTDAPNYDPAFKGDTFA